MLSVTEEGQPIMEKVQIENYRFGGFDYISLFSWVIVSYFAVVFLVSSLLLYYLYILNEFQITTTMSDHRDVLFGIALEKFLGSKKTSFLFFAFFTMLYYAALISILTAFSRNTYFSIVLTIFLLITMFAS
jgi:hypothetical protein